ncbi:unnamed protein product [Choristocarpus tenellus]
MSSVILTLLSFVASNAPLQHMRGHDLRMRESIGSEDQGMTRLGFLRNSVATGTAVIASSVGGVLFDGLPAAADRYDNRNCLRIRDAFLFFFFLHPRNGWVIFIPPECPYVLSISMENFAPIALERSCWLRKLRGLRVRVC